MAQSPAYNVSEIGNGMPDSFNATNSSLNGNNSQNGTSQSIDSINVVKYENENLQASNVSSLPTSSTTATVSMSSNSSATFSTSSVNNNGADGDICRDYLRNVCRRGKSCRFKHPDPAEVDPVARKDSFVFCHDFQNRECRRENCRFLHCSKQEEEIFRGTGKLPQNAQAQLAAEDAKNSSLTPICKDFINGICRRAPGRCKFRHPTTDSFSQSPNNRNSFDGRNGQRNSNYPICPSQNSPNVDFYGRQPPAGGSNMISSSYGYGESYGAENPNKRKRAFESLYSNGPYSSSYGEPMNQVPPPTYSMPASSQYYGARGQMDSRSYLEEENAALRRRIDDLKKQVSELITTNDFLMEQLNQLRVQTAATGPATAVAVATATSVASLQPQAPPPIISSSTATALGIPTPMSQSLNLQSLQAPGVPPPPPGHTAVIHSGALPPSSIVSSIASISLPTVGTVTPAVSLVNSSGAATLVNYTPALISSTHQWQPLGVDQ